MQVCRLGLRREGGGASGQGASCAATGAPPASGGLLAPGKTLRLPFVVGAPGGEPKTAVNIEGILLQPESSRRWWGGEMRRACLALIRTDSEGRSHVLCP